MKNLLVQIVGAASVWRGFLIADRLGKSVNRVRVRCFVSLTPLP